MNRTTSRILIGLGLGVLVGLFLGDYAAPFRYMADIYLRLLQMTVLPYVIVSVIAGFGKLDGSKAKTLFLRVGIVTLALWGITSCLIMLMPLAYPTTESASFFATTLVEHNADFDIISLYIPTNAFQSLANNIVPAVVLFSVVLGIALIGLEEKEPLLSALLVLEKLLTRATKFAVSLTPLGLFAIAANTVGTTDTAELGHLRVFLIAYGAMSLFLALWVLPGFIACLTPIPARRVLLMTKDLLITGFMTGELFVILAALVEGSKDLLREYGFEENTDEGAPADLIIPAFYNIPHVAKLLSLSFLGFAAWTSDTPVTWGTRLRVGLAGIVSLFGSMNSAIPFLLDLAKLPADTFQLFLATGVFNARFGTVAAAMHMVVLAIVGTYAVTGKLQLSPFRIIRYLVITAVLAIMTFGGIRFLIRVTGHNDYHKDEVAKKMQFRTPHKEKGVVLNVLPAEPLPLPGEGRSALDVIRDRHMLRVGFIDGTMPWSFKNEDGELVGFDIEMAHVLAEELGVSLEFVPIPRDQMANVVNSGGCDLIMSGIFQSTLRGSLMSFSAPYNYETIAFIVPDASRADFSSAEWIRSTKGLRIAVPDLPYFKTMLAREFPNVTIVPIPFDNGRLNDFFEGKGEPADALFYTAEQGSFRTLIYPAFSVATPQPLILKIPNAYPVCRNDMALARFLSIWIDLKKNDGTIAALYDHWILGKDAEKSKPHWSIIRDVLHWVD